MAREPLEAELPTQLRGPSEPGEATIVSEETEPMAPDGPARLQRGSTIGRYVVLDVVGEGGMGVVYAAYDPQLDRRIAIKLVRPSRRDGTRGRARLLREAQAIARIRHPNVVAVHDVGAIDAPDDAARGDDSRALVFVAMEFVEGVTLRQWLEREDPTHARIVALFVQAGRGLAAAHQAGIVHRDFKPDNVVVGAGDHAWVVDFGLARGRAASVDGEDPFASSSGSLGGASALTSDLTVAGTVMGTPAFMAPEQHIGADTDAATDQFAFCVALYLALYKERPFAGDTAKALARATLRGDVRAAPPGSKVSAHVRRVLLRGLRPRAADRYPSMAALLTDLQRDLGARRRRILGWSGACVGLVGLAGAAYVSGSRQEPDPCVDAGAEILTVWNPERRAEIGAAFHASGVGYGPDVWTKSAAGIDRWVAAWRDEQAEACRATRVRGSFSEDMLDRRSMCLHGRMIRLEGLLDVLLEADADVVKRSVHMVFDLPEIESCADLDVLTSAVPLPESADERARVRELDAAAERIEAIYHAGRFKEAIDRLEPLLAEAEAMGYLPVVARIRHLLGSAHDSLGDEQGDEILRTSFVEAIEAGEEHVIVRAAVSLAHTLGDRDRRVAEALQYLDVADAVIRRSPKRVGERAGAAAINTRAVLELRAGRREEAGMLFHRLVELQLASDPESPDTVTALQNLGIWYADGSKLALAHEHLERARVLAETLFGETHPELETIYLSMGQIEILRGRYRDARGWLDRALPIQREAFGTESPLVARTLSALAIAARNLGELEEAERLHREALRIRRAHLEPDHPDTAESLRNLAIALSSMERDEEALEIAEEALAMVQRRLPEDSREVCQAHEVVAGMLTGVDRSDEAIPHAKAAVEGLLPEGSEPTAHGLSALITLGDAYRGASRFGDAVRTHARALELAEANGLEEVAPRARVRLAKTLVRQGDDLGRARALLDRAAADIGDSADEHELRGEIEALEAEMSPKKAR